MLDTQYVKEEGPLTLVKRISWPAVFGGIVVALAVQLLLSLLGVGIGASTIDPLQQQNPIAGLGTGTGVWFAVTTIISLFLGGWVAGRLAGINRKLESSLHGLLTWAFTTLIAFYLINAMVAGMISTVGGAVGSGASAVAKGVAAVSPQIGEMANQQLQKSGIDLSSIKNEATTMLKQTGKPALQPGNLQKQAETAADDASQTTTQVAKDPNAADTELNGLIDRVFSKGETTLNEVDKQAVVNVLVARTNMSAAEAGQTVDRWQTAMVTAKAKLDQAKVAAEQKAREVGDVAARNISKGAILGFIGLLLGAIASAVGGLVGRPKLELPIVERREGFAVPRPVH